MESGWFAGHKSIVTEIAVLVKYILTVVFLVDWLPTESGTESQDLDLKRYGRLLARAVPKIIKTEEENERALAIVESLMEKGEGNTTPEEDALLELLTDLVHDFEARAYPIPKSEPHEMVACLLEQRGLAPKDLWPVVGSKSRVSEILSGKRALTKEQAKRLAEFFHAGVELFI